jgi:hypothetical protein
MLFARRGHDWQACAGAGASEPVQTYEDRRRYVRHINGGEGAAINVYTRPAAEAAAAKQSPTKTPRRNLASGIRVDIPHLPTIRSYFAVQLRSAVALDPHVSWFPR